MKNRLLFLFLLALLVISVLVFSPVHHDGVFYPSVSMCLKATSEDEIIDSRYFDVYLYEKSKEVKSPFLSSCNCSCFTTGELLGGYVTLGRTRFKFRERHPYDYKMIKLSWERLGSVHVSINDLKSLPIKQDTLYGPIHQIDKSTFLHFLENNKAK